MTHPVTAGILYYSTPALQNLMALCVRSLKKFAGVDVAVHAVCNGPTDEAFEGLKREGLIDKVYYEDLRGIGSPSVQHGYAKDFLIRNSASPYFFSTEPDVVFCRKGWLAKLLGCLSDRVKVAGPSFNYDVFDLTTVHPCCLLVEKESFQSVGATFAFRGFVQNAFTRQVELVDDGILVSAKHVCHGFQLYIAGQCSRFCQPASVPLPHMTAQFIYFSDDGGCFAIHLGRSGGSPDRYNKTNNRKLNDIIASDDPRIEIKPTGEYGHPKRKEVMEPRIYGASLSSEQKRFWEDVGAAAEQNAGSASWRWIDIDREVKKILGPPASLSGGLYGWLRRWMKRA